MTADKLVAVLVSEKDTKNTVRFRELEQDGPPILETVYVKKWALRKIGDPAKIEITIRRLS